MMHRQDPLKIFGWFEVVERIAASRMVKWLRNRKRPKIDGLPQLAYCETLYSRLLSNNIDEETTNSGLGQWGEQGEGEVRGCFSLVGRPDAHVTRDIFNLNQCINCRVGVSNQDDVFFCLT